MNTQQLECFTTLAKTLNYAKAAARPFANYLGCELPDWCEKICAVKNPEALEALLADFFADKD